MGPKANFQMKISFAQFPKREAIRYWKTAWSVLKTVGQAWFGLAYEGPVYKTQNVFSNDCWTKPSFTRERSSS